MHILENIDGVAVINMDSRPDRFAQFMDKAGRYFPEEKVHRISAVVGRNLPSYGKAPWFTETTGERAGFWGGTGGCALAPRKAIEYAKARGWRHVLVFEDDVVIEFHEGAFDLLENALSELTGPYMLYLGYNKPSPFGSRCMENRGLELWKTDGVIAAHAYIVSAELYDTLLEHMPTEENVWEWLSIYRAIDVLYRDFLPYWKGVSVYVLHPIICVQDDAYSDIGQTSAEGKLLACRQAPGKESMLRRLCLPLRKLKIQLNSCRTHRRALRGGLPGYRKRRKK
jgi:GR25 family glycosyltransferase involved in LPS biosynthesis